MTAARNLAGLVGQGAAPPDRTVTSPPPRRSTGRKSTPGRASRPDDPPEAQPRADAQPGGQKQRRRRSRQNERTTDEPAYPRPDDTGVRARPATVRISVNIPLDAKRWLSAQAREQQRFISEVLMDAVDRHADDVNPPSGRAKRVAVPDGTICSIVLRAEDRARIDDLVARRCTTRSALLTEILRHASFGVLS